MAIKSLIDNLPKFLYIRAEDFDAGSAVVNTGVSPIGNNIIRITGIDWSVTSAGVTSLSQMAADSVGELTLSAGDNELGYDEANMIWTRREALAVTTSGAVLIPASGQETFSPFYCALGQLTLNVVWFAVTAVNARISYDVVAVSELDLLRLIQNRG